ncbi:ricin-type beta-trefoil lectin domain protein [Streptomyces sp. NPDC096311]|uniref:ricin-type beta-trefoil lectin domain protein n=1 Tax=Streptomyces sp. NPDC096311 TaxID=3366083 RepID=UPI0037F7A96C
MLAATRVYRAVTDEGGGAGSGAEGTVFPAPTAGDPPTGGSSAVPPDVSATAGGGTDTRFRNARTGLCLDDDGDRATIGGPAITATCTDRPGRLWRLGTDGLLRNAAEPELCLDSPQPFGLERSPCIIATGDRADDFRYDLSADGLLSSRQDSDLVVNPVNAATGAPIILRTLDSAAPGRGCLWTTQTETPLSAYGLRSPVPYG